MAYHAIRKGDWKLLRNTPFESPILVNLGDDPGEKTAIEGEAKIRRELEAELREHIRKAGFVPWQGRVPDPKKVE
jgi:hypothetical protein